MTATTTTIVKVQVPLNYGENKCLIYPENRHPSRITQQPLDPKLVQWIRANEYKKSYFRATWDQGHWLLLDEVAPQGW